MNARHGVGEGRGETRAAGALTLPPGLVRQLDDFRAAVRRVKGIEALCGALSGVLLAWGALFVVDRLTETPAAVRYGVFLVAAGACALVPLAWQRWFRGLRGIAPVARLVARRFPSLGDEVLGAAELVGNRGEQDRSRVLCEAAVRQVADSAARHDLAAAIPRPRHRQWLAFAALPLAAALVTACVVPGAAANAWQRLLAPWSALPRYTFARLAPLPHEVVVPHGEPVGLPVDLAPDTAWRPARATARLDGGAVLGGDRDGDRYLLALPPQVTERGVRLAVGDARQRVRVVPTMRPEISAVAARVRLPDYLGIPATLERELRGGGLAVVQGSRVAVSATADRALAAATVDDAPLTPDNATIDVPEVEVTQPVALSLAWRDTLGLDGAKPLEVRLVPRADEAPTIAVDGLGGRAVLLDTETVRFSLSARDDFGVERVGIEWVGDGPDGAAGERVLATGGAEEAALDAVGTFAPEELGIGPQTVQVRAFVEDRLPGRGRVRSPPTTFVVMTAADHARWVTDQIGRWRQQAAEVRDRELELLARNEEFVAMSADELDAPDTRKALREQAAAERTLGRLAESGAELVRQATRNPEFDADSLEELAGHVDAVGAMAATRMPRIADLLQSAASAAKGEGQPPRPAPTGAEGKQSPAAPRVGEDRGPGGGKAGRPGAAPSAPVPSVVDRESGVAGKPDGDDEAPPPGGGGPAGLGLPATTIAGSPPKRPPGGNGNAPPGLEEAVEEQRRLIEDFAAIAKQLADVMARLEGTTFVKRLKAASRAEAKVGEGLSAVVGEAFGRSVRPPAAESLAAKVARVGKGNDQVQEKVASVMDDLDAYFERRPQPQLRTVLEEMRDLDILGSLRQLSQEMPRETGLSIARSEFWADTLDRWADELVPPPGNCPPGPSGPQASLPPEVVLEAMRILEAEANLREETRVTQQVRGTLDAAALRRRTGDLAGAQEALADRVAALARRLADQPTGPMRFADEIERMRRDMRPGNGEGNAYAREIALFREVERVMDEATDILASSDTGRRAIAAETEAIELLLRSRACGGGGGGNSGSSPGQGGGGTTRDPALARLGRGINAQARPGAGEEDQAVGKGGRVLPEEFRDGLDSYFNAIERKPAGGEAGQP